MRTEVAPGFTIGSRTAGDISKFRGKKSQYLVLWPVDQRDGRDACAKRCGGIFSALLGRKNLIRPYDLTFPFPEQPHVALIRMYNSRMALEVLRKAKVLGDVPPLEGLTILPWMQGDEFRSWLEHRRREKMLPGNRGV